MNRRTFIRITGITAAVSTTPWLTSCSRKSRWTDVLAVPETLGKFCGKEELVAIGKVYIQSSPGERNASVLEEALLRGDDQNKYEPSSIESLTQFINEKIAHDFSTHHLEVIRGWVLSRTEARQTALYSLINS
jgi:hypothetical protein